MIYKAIFLVLSLSFLSLTFYYEKANSESDEREGNLPGIFTNETDRAEMILIPKGKFLYGISRNKRNAILRSLSTPLLPLFDFEFPEETKDLDDYYIDKYEITNEQYSMFLKAKPEYQRRPRFWSDKRFNQPRQPVVGIGWADAIAYAEWAGKRLPSEEEWEKAARGTVGYIWPWGNEPSDKKHNGNALGKNAPMPVGSFPDGASPYGVMDMAGNVYEMIAKEATWGKEEEKVIRGGSYANSAAYTRTMFRWAPDDDVNGDPWLGFRCVMDADKVKKRLQSKSGIK